MASGGMAFSDSTPTSGKTWGQLMKVEEYSWKGIPSADNNKNYENYPNKMSTLDSNLVSNVNVEVWIITKPQQYYDCIIVSNVGRCSKCKLSSCT